MANEAFQKHLNDYLSKKKIADLLDKLNEKLETPISYRAVTKWKKGDACPKTEHLVALSEIFNCTVDDLLKDKKETIRFKDSLPEWYENLSEQSKKIVLAALEPYRTGKIYAHQKAFLHRLSYRYATNEIDFVPFYSGLIPFKIFFSITKNEDDFQIITDKYYTCTEMAKREIKIHQKKLQIELLKSYPNNLPKNSNPNHPEELLRAIDIGYVEEETSYANFYGRPYEYGIDKDGIPELMTREEQQTEAWNEIAYTFMNNSDLLQDYKDRALKLAPLEKYLEKQKELIKKQYFQELLDLEIVEFSYNTAYIDFGPSEFDFDTSKEYLEVTGFFVLPPNDIQNILTREYEKTIRNNINNVNNNALKYIEFAQHLNELSKFLVLKSPLEPREEQSEQNNEDDA